MSDLKVSSLIKTLSENYLNNRITFAEYRLERKIILRQIDTEFNQRIFDNIDPQIQEMKAYQLPTDYGEVTLDEPEKIDEIVELENSGELQELYEIEFDEAEEEQLL